MATTVFVGRPRQPLKLVAFQLLTLGVYGRVYLYKLLREIDGHEALFLDRRPYLFLLVLPVMGPFFVKRRIVHLLGDVTHHDVTAEPHHPGRLLGLAMLPLAPLFHLAVNRHLGHHWKMHAKADEVEVKKEHLSSLRRRARSPESLQAVKELEREIAVREKELENLRSAALALREAEDVRRHAEAQLRRSGVRAGPLGMVRKLLPAAALRRARRRSGGDELESEAPEDIEPEPPSAPRKGRRPIAEPEPEPETQPAADPLAAPESEAAEPAPRTGILGFLRRRQADEGADRQPKPTRAEKRALKQKAKEEKRAAKLEAKEAARAGKEAAKAAKGAEKERRKKEKSSKEREAKASAKGKRPAGTKGGGRDRPR